MRDLHRPGRWLFLSILLTTGAILQSATPGLANELGTIVPAYFYPGTGGAGGVGDGWAELTAAAFEIPVTAVLNPDSGPLPGPPDPNYVTAMSNLESAGGHVVAYVYTDYASTPIAVVEGEVDTYVSQYGSLINGFYLDGMANNWSSLSYYEALYSYIKGLNSSYTVIGNPGTLVPAGYLSAANILNVFEGDNEAFKALRATPSSRYSYTVYDATTEADMLDDIQKAGHLNAGDIFVTDQPLNPATGYLYDQLPSYWDQEVAAIKLRKMR